MKTLILPELSGENNNKWNEYSFRHNEVFSREFQWKYKIFGNFNSSHFLSSSIRFGWFFSVSSLLFFAIVHAPYTIVLYALYALYHRSIDYYTFLCVCWNRSNWQSSDVPNVVVFTIVALMCLVCVLLRFVLFFFNAIFAIFGRAALLFFYD